MISTATQRQRILELLKQRGSLGVNSYELTYKYSIKQAPTRIYELKKLGHKISSSFLKDRSVQYTLDKEMVKERTIHPLNQIVEAFHYHWTDTSGEKVIGNEESCISCNPKPVQQSFFNN